MVPLFSAEKSDVEITRSLRCPVASRNRSRARSSGPCDPLVSVAADQIRHVHVLSPHSVGQVVTFEIDSSQGNLDV